MQESKLIFLAVHALLIFALLRPYIIDESTYIEAMQYFCFLVSISGVLMLLL